MGKDTMDMDQYGVSITTEYYELIMEISDALHTCYHSDLFIGAQYGCECGCGGASIDWEYAERELEDAHRFLKENLPKLKYYYKEDI